MNKRVAKYKCGDRVKIPESVFVERPLVSGIIERVYWDDVSYDHNYLVTDGVHTSHFSEKRIISLDLEFYRNLKLEQLGIKDEQV